MKSVAADFADGKGDGRGSVLTTSRAPPGRAGRSSVSSRSRSAKTCFQVRAGARVAGAAATLFSDGGSDYGLTGVFAASSRLAAAVSLGAAVGVAATAAAAPFHGFFREVSVFSSAGRKMS